MKKKFLAALLFLVLTLNGQTNIAVIDFEGKNVSKADASALTDRLRLELFLTGKFVVLEREKMDAILKEQQFQLSGCTSDACAVEVGQLLAVEQMVAGSVSKVGQTYSVTARLIDVAKGNLISGGKCDLKGDIGDVMTCLNAVAAQLAGNLSVTASKPTSESPQTDGLPDMVFIKGGTFQMGSNDGKGDEKPVHTVTMSDFWMGKYEVTVAEFEKFIAETGYQTNADKGDGSYLWTGSIWEKRAGINWRCDAQGNVRRSSELNHPVIHVSWNDAVAYCEWLSRKIGKMYRLPTEAEWEYTARSGGKNYKYSWGNFDPEGRKGGNIRDESAKRALGWSGIWDGYDDGYVYTAPVGSFEPNELGLYDITGNVWEWCQDWYDSKYYQNSTQNNPAGPSSGTYRVLRGGSWLTGPFYVRCSIRHFSDPDNRFLFIGFRIARDH
ncbi:MAG: SUMF1/EgtB/PvdO family nonheme iron enzyme [Candidatus Marinimicrobia bacterium]|jgi:formylglycine-generating enzyme required for sulfatase activity|nr:SUMF1/EgtB/PvdO family nonheme iron enzyme [Candidatus Neomarinimicrobiota bacterium]